VRAAVAAIVTVTAIAGCSRSPTYTRNVAPIIQKRCAPCHHAGGAGPFALVTYADAAPRARQIARVTARGYMPPWKATATGEVAYANERGLDAGERAILQRWATAGAPRGDGPEPAPPSFFDGWQLGRPDLVVKMEPYALAADGPDVYRNFVLPAPLAATGGARWVAAWELRTGSRAVHHAILNLDATGWARERDGRDAEPGFAGMDPGDLQAPDGFYLVWTPGQAPTPPQAGAAWPLEPSTDLVLQLHLRPSGKPELVAPVIGLYFAPAPPTSPRVTLRLGDVPIDIAPGVRDYSIRDRWTLPVAVELVSLFPHAHYLAQRMRVWARLPDGQQRPLLNIEDWDPAWQDEYVLATPLALPAGSTLEMAFSYDNSDGNVRNPNHPPARVVTGERTVDEMGNVTLVARVASGRDKTTLREAKYRRQLAAGAGPRVRYNLANTLMAQGRTREAIDEYRRALAGDDALLPAHVNLGAALLALGEVEPARVELEAAARRWPGSATAQANWGRALAATGRRTEAMVALTRALAIDPSLAPARAALQALERAAK